MVKYHGTPISGSRQDAARFLQGRHALVPYPRPDDLPIVADVCSSFVLDNGAYTLWQQGHQGGYPFYAEYVAWVRQWHRHPGFDWAVIPDDIEGTEEDNRRLVEQWPADLAGVPVIHMHHSLDRAHELATTYPRVALGGGVGYGNLNAPNWWPRMREIMQAVCDSDGRPLAKLHGLRILNPEVFTLLPLSSGDSTNAAQNCSQVKRFGQYVPPTASQRADVIASRIESYNSAPLFICPAQQSSFFMGADALLFNA